MEFTRQIRGWALAAALGFALGCGGSTRTPPENSGAGGAGGDTGAGDANGAAGTTGGAPGGGSGNGDASDGGSNGDGADARMPAVDRDATLEIMRRVADYELTRFGTATNANWVRAVFYTGLLALYRTTGDAKYLTATQTWGTSNNWRLGTDSGASVRWADNQACVQSYADLYLMNPTAANDVMVAPGRAAFDQMVAAPMTGRVEWWWEDALFMAPPALARIAQATPARSAAYLSLLHTMWWDTKAFLFSDANQLMWRDSTFLNTATFWSRGNGWVVAGIARLLDALPLNDTRRADYEGLLRTMAGKLRTIQADDGFWRSDLLNPSAFPTPESSGTAFFCYGIAWGIHHGVLDRATYLDTALRAWSALGTAVTPAGRLGWVQAVGARPGPSNMNDTNDYATGAFLLAGTELLTL
jgi:unsaturated rhamnogalacturonyl hydrolase